MLNRANKNSCYFDKCLFKACFVSIAVLVMTGKLSRNCIITNIKCKGKAAQHDSARGRVTFATAVAPSMKSAAAPSPTMASGKCCAAAAAPGLLTAQQLTLSGHSECSAREGDRDTIFSLVHESLREGSVTAFAARSPRVQHSSPDSSWASTS